MQSEDSIIVSATAISSKGSCVVLRNLGALREKTSCQQMGKQGREFPSVARSAIFGGRDSCEDGDDQWLQIDCGRKASLKRAAGTVELSCCFAVVGA